MQNLPLTNTIFNLDCVKDPHTAINELNKSVYFPEDPLYDGAYYIIKKNLNTFDTEALLYLFTNEDSKMQGESATEVAYNLVITKDTEYCFDFITNYYLNENPETPFDSIFVTVHKDGRYIVNYEYKNEEVQPQFKRKDEYTFSDYGESWYNCISQNAPDEVEWVWMILERDTTNLMIGEFYYSMNEDKSNPISIAPGEYVYMYNITTTMVEKFYKNISSDWKKLFIGFDNEKLHIGIIEKLK